MRDPRDPERFFVQTSETHSTCGLSGWQTSNVFLDRETAQRMADSLERATRWEEGREVTSESVLFARVVSAEQLFAEEGAGVLQTVDAATQKQLELRLKDK